jgi:hypothetical protein
VTLSDYRNTKSWQSAIELGPGLMVLAEELPAAEELGLNFQLRKIMVELPAAIATDLLQGTKTRFDTCLRLASALELIERVYPALDTAATRAEAEKLIERLLDESFDDSLSPQPSAAPVVVEPAPVAPGLAPAPASVPVVPEPAAEPVEPEPAPVEPTHVTVDQAAPEDQAQNNV